MKLVAALPKKKTLKVTSITGNLRITMIYFGLGLNTFLKATLNLLANLFLYAEIGRALSRSVFLLPFTDWDSKE
jgi:hypothetical protein